MTDRTAFGEWLRQRRHLLDLTQAELADLSSCSTVTIRKLEAGERKPSAELARAIAAALRIPARERHAFVDFARSKELEASFRLPAWPNLEPSWRQDQLPDRPPEFGQHASHTNIQYDLMAQRSPQVTQIQDGRYLVHFEASGAVTGDLEGMMHLMITQVISPKPPTADYTQALPMRIGARFKIITGEEWLRGNYIGTISPLTDASGSGEARVQATGQIIGVSPAYIDLFLDYVFVDDTVRMVEGTGTGAKGRMHFKSPA